MKKIILLITAIMITNSYAAIYMKEDSTGNTTYSDTPSSNATQIAAPPVNTVTTTQPAQQPAATSTETAAAKPGDNTTQPAAENKPVEYKVFEITSPKNEETITNQPVIPVTMNVDPRIEGEDRIQLILDGKPAGVPTSTIYQELGFVERGTHQLSAEIIDKNGSVLKTSNTVTIYVHRNSVITSPASR